MFEEPIPGKYYFIPAVGYLQENRRVHHLRRYQVIDEYGRPQDIRTWTDAIDKVFTRYGTDANRFHRNDLKFEPSASNFFLSYTGAKPHTRRMSGPAMYRNTQRLLSSTEDLDAELTERFRVVVPKCRNIWSADEVYDKAEKKYFGMYGQRSWKNSKVRNQWAKHKSGADRRGIRYLDGAYIKHDDNIQDGYAS